jgi:hypothetical protein
LIVLAIARRTLLAARPIFARRTVRTLLAFAAFARFAAAFATFFAFVRAIAVAAATAATAFATTFTVELLLRLLALREFNVRLIALAAAFTAFGRFGLGARVFVALGFVVAIAVVHLLGRRRSWLHRPPQAEIVICVLQIILAQHAIAGTRRIARELQIPLMDVSRRPAHFYFRAVAFHLPVRVLLMVVSVMTAATTTWLTAAAPLTLH